MNKKEEITDMITPEAYDDPAFKPGLALKFERATIKITKVDRKNKRAWGEHITLLNYNNATSHYGHNIDVTEEARARTRGEGWCDDCQTPLGDPSTEDGDKAALDREDERRLSDGTLIEE